ncbi:MAG: O-antigen ligase family protein [Patescibacteria group bacterium]|jgi:O-antigen ligase
MQSVGITWSRGRVWLLASVALVLSLPIAWAASREPLLVLGGIVGMLALGVCIARPWWGMLGVIFLLPFERIGSIDLVGITIRPSQVLAVCVLVAWLVRVMVRGRLRWEAQPLLWPMLVFLAVQAIALTHVANSTRGIAVFAFTAFTFAVCLVVPQLVRSEAHARAVILTLSISTFLVAGFGLFQFLGDFAGLPTSVTGLRDLYTKAVLGFPRVQSTALEPLYFANFLLLPLSFLTALLFGREARRGLLGIPLLLIAGLAFVLTVARGGYIAFAASLIVILALSWRQLLHPGRILAFGAGAVVIGVFALQLLNLGTDAFSAQKFSDHVRNLFTGASYEERIDTFTLAQQAFREQPLVGIGPGQFGPYASINPFYQPKDGWKIVNNLSLELLAETGLLGTFAIASAFLILLIRSVRALRAKPQPYVRALIVGGTAVVVGIMVQYQTFSILYIMHVWVAIGLLIAFQNLALRKPAVPNV